MLLKQQKEAHHEILSIVKPKEYLACWLLVKNVCMGDLITTMYRRSESKCNQEKLLCYINFDALHFTRTGFESLQGDLRMAFIMLGEMLNDSGARIFLLGDIKV